MATSTSLRLDQDLVNSATAEAKRMKRSGPKQIEYWAELGRAIEKAVDPDTLIALEEGLVQLKVEPLPSAPASSSDVFSDIEAAQAEGQLPSRVTSAKLSYQASRGKPGLLEQIHPDGSIITGHFHQGRFKPIK